MTAIDRLKRHYKVEIVDDERGIGNGVIVTLKKGWTFSVSEDNRVRGADTVREALKDVKLASRHDGPFDA